MSKFAQFTDAEGLTILDVTRIVAAFRMPATDDEPEHTMIETDVWDGDGILTHSVNESVMQVHTEIERCLRTMKPEQ